MFKRIKASIQYRSQVLRKKLERLLCRYKLWKNSRRMLDSRQKVSIIVPVYNAEKYLRQCLDSILEQTYKHIEVVCVNDCSTDSSLDILKEYAQKDSRVVIEDKPVNEGSSYARKTGLANSSGEWTLMVDSDDWIENNMVESLLGVAISGGVDMAYCEIFWGISEDGDEYATDHPDFPRDKLQRIKNLIFGQGCSSDLWNKLVKKDVYEKIEFPKENFGEDKYIVCQLFYYCNTVGYVPFALYHYRFSGNSLTNDPQNAHLRYLEVKANFDHVIRFCREKFGDDLSAFEPELSEMLAYVEKVYSV